MQGFAPVDEDFPTRRHWVSALSVALISAVIGFSLSYQWLVSHRPFSAPRPVDRKQAEGRSPSGPHRGAGHPHFAAPGSRFSLSGGVYETPTPQARELPEQAKLEKLKEALQPPESGGESTRPRVAAVVNPGSHRPPPRKPRRHKQEAAPAPDPASGRSFPPAGRRAPAGSLADAWETARPGVVAILGYNDFACSGTLIDSDLVVTRDDPAVRQSGLRATLAGSPCGVSEVVGYDPAHELIVLRLQGAGSPAALSPEAPSPGEELALAAGNQQGSESCLVLGDASLVGDGCFRFQGATFPSNAGSPLVNSRGEVAGLCLGKPWSYPGNNYAIGVDTAVLWGLREQARAGRLATVPPELGGFSRSVRQLMLGSLPRPETTSTGRANARAVPGVSLGNYPIGATRQDLEREFGPGSVASFPGGFESVEVAPYPVRFTLLDDRVVAISTTDRFYGTSRGIGVGASRHALPDDPDLEGAVLGVTPAGRMLLVGEGLELSFDQDGQVESLMVVGGGP